MAYSRELGLAFALLLQLACTMTNPAFEDGDELGDEIVADASTDESTTRTTDESGTEGSDSSSTSDDATTQNSTLDNGSSEDTTESETEDTTESETGISCGDGMALCDGICVDVSESPNCGDCGIQCADNQLCVGFCSPEKYVFVSSEPLNGAMGGILGADEFCNDLAFQAGLPGDYLAWNSTVQSYPDFDFVKEGVYIRTDGTVVANSYEDLTDGTLANPISLDENGFAAAVMGVAGCPNVTSPVWSNTTPYGEFAGGLACTGWTINSNITTATIGKAIATDAHWSQIPNCNIPCGSYLPIYCVQQNP